MDIGIVGAGGIGSYYAGVLSRAGHSVRLLARGEHLAAIKARGLEVRTPAETFVATPDATSDSNELARCDYIIVAVKGYSLPEVAPTLVAAAVVNGSTIVPFLNGIDVPERLAALGVPMKSIVGGLVVGSLVRTEPGVVERRSSFDRVVVGELDGVAANRSTHLVKVFGDAGVAARLSADIVLDLWRKFAFIVPIGVVCGLTRQPIGRVVATEVGRTLAAATVSEVVHVSRHYKGALGEEDASQIRNELFALPAQMRPSFLLDLERGGPTELDLLAGTVSRLGRERAVPTPIHDLATAAFDIATQVPA